MTFFWHKHNLFQKTERIIQVLVLSHTLFALIVCLKVPLHVPAIYLLIGLNLLQITLSIKLRVGESEIQSFILRFLTFLNIILSILLIQTLRGFGLY